MRYSAKHERKSLAQGRKGPAKAWLPAKRVPRCAKKLSVATETVFRVPTLVGFFSRDKTRLKSVL